METETVSFDVFEMPENFSWDILEVKGRRQQK